MDEGIPPDRTEVKPGAGGALGPSGWLARLILITTSVLALYWSGYAATSAMDQRVLHWLFMGVAAFLILSGRKEGRPRERPTALDWVFVAVVVASSVYIFLTWEEKADLIEDPTWEETLLGALMFIAAMEAARRAVGPVLPTASALFLVYAYFGPWMPGMFKHKGYAVERIVRDLYVISEGLYGIPMYVSSSFIIMFVLFGAFLAASGGGKFFIDVSHAIAGRFRGGPAKTAVLSSGLMGMVSGSPVGNVVTTGTFTIPLMKRMGYPPLLAGAIEACASTGGMFTPPVMGAGAFIMAEYLGVSYGKVAIAAAIPALLFYLAVLLFVDIEAVKRGMRGLSKEELPSIRKVLAESGYLALPLITLIVFIVLGYSAMLTAFWAIFMVFLFVMMNVDAVKQALKGWPNGDRPTFGTISLDSAYMVVPLVVMGISIAAGADPSKAACWAALLIIGLGALRRPSRERVVRAIRALEEGARNTLPVAAACAAAGIIVGVIGLTGVGVKFSSVILSMSGDWVVIALVFAMLSALVLGCGMPPTAVYIIMAALTVPPLLKIGINEVAAHMFVFHFSTIGAITPPVALAAYAAATISKGNPMQTGFMAFRVGIIAYIVPFMFAYSPTLVAQGPFYKVVLALVTACLGVICVCAAVQGFFLKPFRWWARGVFLLAGILLVRGGVWSDLVGIGLGLTAFRLGGQDRESWREASVLSREEPVTEPIAEAAVNRETSSP
ncbi:MAG: TRAP transporter permease [Nitrospinota bacterium]